MKRDLLLVPALAALSAAFGCRSPQAEEPRPAATDATQMTLLLPPQTPVSTPARPATSLPTPAADVDLEAANRECFEGKGQRCFHVAQILEHRATLGETAPWDAVTSYIRACRGDYVPGCLRLGEIHSTDEYLLKRPEDALRFFTTACEHGEARGCLGAGVAHENGAGVRRSFAKALESYNQACRAGATAGCDAAKKLEGLPEPSASPPPSAEELTLLTCESGGVDACIRVGEMYEKSAGQPGDTEKAAQLYRKLCRLAGEDARGCNLASRLYRSTAWPGRDPAVAARCSQRACDRISAKRFDLPKPAAEAALAGCKDLARMYEAGTGVEKDLAHAAELFGKTCTFLDAEGCYEEGLRYQRGEGIPRDEARATACFKTACLSGERRACAAVGQ